MRTLLQNLVLITILVVLVGGVTFMSMFLNLTPPEPVKKSVHPDPAPTEEEPKLLNFIVEKPEFEGENVFPPECELGKRGYKEYWFENVTADPVELRVYSVSCACSEVQVGLVTPRTWKEFVRWSPAVTAQVLAGTGETIPVLGTVFPAVMRFQQFEEQIQWQKLEVPKGSESKPVVVPPSDPKEGPTAGAFRLIWKGDRPGPVRLVIRGTAQSPMGTAMWDMAMPAIFSTALRLLTSENKIADLASGGQQQTEFICYSATRSAFPLTVQPDPPHPCFTCTTKPLSAEECKVVEKTAHGRVLSGYRVNVTVQERLPDGSKQLDLGTFRHRIHFRGDGDMDLAVGMVTGIVRGEVIVGAPEDQDRIDFKPFPASRGAEKRLALHLTGEVTQLAIDSKTPDYLNVKLSPPDASDSKGPWKLFVQVPPGQAAGPLPSNSVVVLQTRGAVNRKIRIPVSGNAYNK